MYSWENILKRIEHVKNPVGAEIGVWYGHLSRRLLENREDLFLYMIDSWSPVTYVGKDQNEESASFEMIKKYHSEALENYKLAKLVHTRFIDRSKMIMDFSVDAALEFPSEWFDFVYIDAAHDYDSVKADIEAWFSKVKTGGFIGFHDYGGKFKGVKKAVDEIFGSDVEVDSDYTAFVRK